jgi:hypothetical protein
MCCSCLFAAPVICLFSPIDHMEISLADLVVDLFLQERLKEGSFSRAFSSCLASELFAGIVLTAFLLLFCDVV